MKEPASHVSLAQLVERWLPNPNVVCSSRTRNAMVIQVNGDAIDTEQIVKVTSIRSSDTGHIWHEFYIYYKSTGAEKVRIDTGIFATDSPGAKTISPKLLICAVDALSKHKVYNAYLARIQSLRKNIIESWSGLTIEAIPTFEY